MSEQTAPLSQERQDLLETLGVHRYFLISATEGITDEQARQRTTVSALTLGGLIKHVSATEKTWAEFIVNGPVGHDPSDESEPVWDPNSEAVKQWAAQFTLNDDESLEWALSEYATVAAATDDLVRTVDLDLAWPLPKAPWFAPGATRTARRSLMHIVAETAQHAGHADIIRESLDGKKSMG